MQGDNVRESWVDKISGGSGQKLFSVVLHVLPLPTSPTLPPLTALLAH